MEGLRLPFNIVRAMLSALLPLVGLLALSGVSNKWLGLSVGGLFLLTLVYAFTLGASASKRAFQTWLALRNLERHVIEQIGVMPNRFEKFNVVLEWLAFIMALGAFPIFIRWLGWFYGIAVAVGANLGVILALIFITAAANKFPFASRYEALPADTEEHDDDDDGSCYEWSIIPTDSRWQPPLSKTLALMRTLISQHIIEREFELDIRGPRTFSGELSGVEELKTLLSLPWQDCQISIEATVTDSYYKRVLAPIGFNPDVEVHIIHYAWRNFFPYGDSSINVRCQKCGEPVAEWPLDDTEELDEDLICDNCDTELLPDRVIAVDDEGREICAARFAVILIGTGELAGDLSPAKMPLLDIVKPHLNQLQVVLSKV